MLLWLREAMGIGETNSFLFVSHEGQLQRFGLIAEELKKRVDLRAVLWTLGADDKAAGVATGSFDHVADLIEGFDRFARIGPELLAENVRRVCEYEARFGEIFYHFDAALDRGLTGFTDAEVDVTKVKNRWTHEQIAALAVHLLERAERELEEYRVVLSIGEFNTMAYRLVHRLLKYKGVEHLYPSYLPHSNGRMYWEETMDHSWLRCRETYMQFLAHGVPSKWGRMAAQIHDEITRGAKPEYFMLSSRGPRPWRERLRVERLAATLREWRTARTLEAQSNPRNLAPELLSPWARLVRGREASKRRRYYERVASRNIPQQEYATYFLHVQPEYTVESLAFEYQDQVAFVRNVVAGLPAGMLLVVKEHKPQAGRRSVEFYGELSSIPNVVLLHDTVDSLEVLRKAKLLVALTGTVTLEAICAGIPTVQFGNVYYEQFRGVYRAHNYGEYRAMMTRLDSLHPATAEEAIAALAARCAMSYEAEYPGVAGDRNNAQRLAASLECELQRRGIVLTRRMVIAG